MSEEQNETGAASQNATESTSAGQAVKQKWFGVLRGLWEDRRHPRVYAPAAGVLALLVGLAAFALYRPDFRLAGDLEWLAGVVPVEGTDLYIEVKEPAAFYKLWLDSETGTKIAAAPAFHTLRNERLAGVQTILYLLELKAGFSFETPFDYFKESVGLALAGDDTLLVARTDLSSRAGVALVKAMAAKTIYLPGESLVDEAGNRKAPEKEQEAEGGSTHAPESLPVLVERRERLNNLELTVLQNGPRKYYLVLLDEYLFAATNIELLRNSLSLATGIGGASLGAAAGMQGARESLGRGDGRALFYLNAKAPWLPAVGAALLGGEAGLAGVLRAAPDETLSFDTFSVGPARLKDPAAASKGPEPWPDAPSYFPGDAALTLLFRESSPAQLVAKLAEVDGRPAEFAQALRAYFQGGGSIDEFEEPGLGLSFLGFQRTRKRLVPRAFVGLFAAEKKVASLGTLVFRKAGEDRREFQGLSYLVANQGVYFRPARVFFGQGDGAAAGFLASDEETLRAVLNARKGNRSDLSDLKTLAMLGEFRAAPTQLMVDVKAASAALRDFYLLGAERSDRYSAKTIENDIDPLLAPLARYTTLHLAHGLAGPVHGRLVLAAAE